MGKACQISERTCSCSQIIPDLSQMGIIRVYSALDSFLVEVHAEYCRKASIDKLPMPAKLKKGETETEDDENGPARSVGIVLYFIEI